MRLRISFVVEVPDGEWRAYGIHSKPHGLLLISEGDGPFETAVFPSGVRDYEVDAVDPGDLTPIPTATETQD